MSSSGASGCRARGRRSSSSSPSRGIWRSSSPRGRTCDGFPHRPRCSRRAPCSTSAFALLGWPIRWRVMIREFDPPYRFVDVQLWGPFARWEHRHRFVAGPPERRRVGHRRYVGEGPPDLSAPARPPRQSRPCARRRAPDHGILRPPRPPPARAPLVAGREPDGQGTRARIDGRAPALPAQRFLGGGFGRGAKPPFPSLLGRDG